MGNVAVHKVQSAQPFEVRYPLSVLATQYSVTAEFDISDLAAEYLISGAITIKSATGKYSGVTVTFLYGKNTHPSLGIMKQCGVTRAQIGANGTYSSGGGVADRTNEVQITIANGKFKVVSDYMNGNLPDPVVVQAFMAYC